LQPAGIVHPSPFSLPTVPPCDLWIWTFFIAVSLIFFCLFLFLFFYVDYASFWIPYDDTMIEDVVLVTCCLFPVLFTQLHIVNRSKLDFVALGFYRTSRLWRVLFWFTASSS
jgi:hypothetical protein